VDEILAGRQKKEEERTEEREKASLEDARCMA
jgi:hypothetical protein